jgi:hypothetical protein
MSTKSNLKRLHEIEALMKKYQTSSFRDEILVDLCRIVKEQARQINNLQNTVNNLRGSLILQDIVV